MYTPAWWSEQVCLSYRRSSCTRPSRCLQSGSCSSEAAPGLGSGTADGGGLGEPHGSREPPPWSPHMTTPKIIGKPYQGFWFSFKQYDKTVWSVIILCMLVHKRCFVTQVEYFIPANCNILHSNLSENTLQFSSIHLNGRDRKTNGQVTFFSPARAFVKWPRHSQTSVQPEISICKRHHVPAQHSRGP